MQIAASAVEELWWVRRRGSPRSGDQGAFLTRQESGAHRAWSARRPPVSAGHAGVDQTDRQAAAAAAETMVY